jgi:hypothetical protein
MIESCIDWLWIAVPAAAMVGFKIGLMAGTRKR